MLRTIDSKLQTSLLKKYHTNKENLPQLQRVLEEIELTRPSIEWIFENKQDEFQVKRLFLIILRILKINLIIQLTPIYVFQHILVFIS